MHQLEGGDYQNVSGEHRFKDTDPATEVVASDMNAVYLSLLRLVTASGQTLKADGAADASDDWMQIVRAVKRLARQDAWTDVDLAPIGPTAAIIDSDRDKHLFRINDPGGSVSLNVALPTSSTAHNGRAIILYNNTGVQLSVNGWTESYPLYPEEAGIFVADMATVAEWRKVGPDIAALITAALAPILAKFTDGSTSTTLTGGTTTNSLSATPVASLWRVVEKQLFVTVKAFGATALAANEAYLKFTPGPNVSLPWPFNPGISRVIEIGIGVTPTYELGVARLMDSGEMRIYRLNGTDFASGQAIQVRAFDVSCGLP